LQVNSNHIRKHKTRMERITKDKHLANCKLRRKKFYNIAPGPNVKKFMPVI
jgi:hypothetical protein